MSFRHRDQQDLCRIYDETGSASISSVRRSGRGASPRSRPCASSVTHALGKEGRTGCGTAHPAVVEGRPDDAPFTSRDPLADDFASHGVAGSLATPHENAACQEKRDSCRQARQDRYRRPDGETSSRHLLAAKPIGKKTRGDRKRRIDLQER